MSLDERADELDKKMEQHPAEEAIRVLTKDANTRKLQVKILSIVVVLVVLLTAGLSFALYQTNQLAQLAQSNRDAVVANCETANESRRNQRALWDYVFSISPEKPLTNTQKVRTEKFRDFVAKTFAERDCQAEINK